MKEGARGLGSHRPVSGRDKGQRLGGSGASAALRRGPGGGPAGGALGGALPAAAPAAAAARGAWAARGAGGTRPETRRERAAPPPAAVLGAVNHALPARC